MQEEIKAEAETTEKEDTAAENESKTEEAEACDEVKEPKGDKKKVKKLESEIAGLKKQLNDSIKSNEDLNDKYLRMIAEYDNFRKRSAKEKESTYTEAYSSAVNEILPVLDNLERASGCDDANGLKKGLELTLKSFSETFDKLGVKEIEAMGQKFDPNVHCAVMHIEDEAYGENEVIEVLQKGYIKGDKVIRYAMVKVAN